MPFLFFVAVAFSGASTVGHCSVQGEDAVEQHLQIHLYT